MPLSIHIKIWHTCSPITKLKELKAQLYHKSIKMFNSKIKLLTATFWKCAKLSHFAKWILGILSVCSQSWIKISVTLRTASVTSSRQVLSIVAQVLTMSGARSISWRHHVAHKGPITSLTSRPTFGIQILTIGSRWTARLICGNGRRRQDIRWWAVTRQARQGSVLKTQIQK